MRRQIRANCGMRPRKILVANRCSFTLPPEVKAAAEERAKAHGIGFAPYVAALVRNDLMRPHADLVVVTDKRRARV